MRPEWTGHPNNTLRDDCGENCLSPNHGEFRTMNRSIPALSISLTASATIYSLVRPARIPGWWRRRFRKPGYLPACVLGSYGATNLTGDLDSDCRGAGGCPNLN
jgi:hypothetical protein